jgi:hypothetical protein
MTSTTWTAIRDGLTVHRDFANARRNGVSPSRVLAVGDEIEIDELFLANSRDAYGRSAFDDLSDDAQRRNWGQVFLTKKKENAS